MSNTASPPKFPYKTQPLQHQRDTLNRSCPREYFGVLSEQGTGKTKIIIDNVAWLYLKGRVKGMLVVAPNGVHENWTLDEIPAHMSEEVGYKTFTWYSGKAGNVSFKEEWDKFLRFSRGLAIFAINIDALITKRGTAAAKRFLMSRDCMMVVDEAQDIARAGATRTQKVRTLGKYAKYRRIASGTLARDGSPLDLYAPMQFLSPQILRCASHIAFKHDYAEWRTIEVPTGTGKVRKVELLATDKLTGRPKFKNLERLNKLIEPHIVRYRKDDVLDLPPKVYSKRYCGLSNEQTRMYKELLLDFQTQFESGEFVTVDIKIVQYLRLQQIICGFVPVDPRYDESGELIANPTKLIPGDNPRVEALVRTLADYPGKSIVWCRFKPDVKILSERLSKEGYTVLTYTGEDKVDARKEARHKFQRDSHDETVFLMNQQAGARGITLTEARNAIYYSNYFGLELRLQSEDRPHRFGLKHPLNIIDIVAENTVDNRIINALRSKRSVFDILMGDPTKDWI